MGSNPPIQCLIKTPVFLEVGPYKSDLRSGCCIVDVTFPNLFYVEVIINYLHVALLLIYLFPILSVILLVKSCTLNECVIFFAY